MKTIEAVIFDCAGVVVDSDQLQRDAEQQTVPIFAEANGWESMQGWARKKIASTIFGVEFESEHATRTCSQAITALVQGAHSLQSLTLIVIWTVC